MVVDGGTITVDASDDGIHSNDMVVVNGGAIEIATGENGLIVHAEQAEQILAEGRADLVALAREMLYNPNWAMDAAQKLGADPQFALVPPPYRYWLSRRAATLPDIKPSTFGGSA